MRWGRVDRYTRFESTRNFLVYEILWFFMALAFMAFWALVFYGTPDSLVRSRFVSAMVSEVSTHIGMIEVYAANSPDPPRVAFFMTFQWLMVPIYVSALWARLDWNLLPTMRLFDKLLYGVALLLFGISPLIFFTEPSDFTGRKIAQLLVSLQSSHFLSFLNSFLWPGIFVFAIVGAFTFMVAPLKRDDRNQQDGIQ